ncbi:hypothetical protein VTN77DRAFT_4781 [Rasamsonia byssochlamydoides]|uniref:uncharacterized protein n=1 Tax=Rasamsonia byssochlamydoides TaxID=89139 RepID=UPI003743CCC1
MSTSTSTQYPPNPLADKDHTGKSPSATSHLRLARPSRDLAAAERFYVNGLGLKVLFRKSPSTSIPTSAAKTQGLSPGHGHKEDDLLMLGWPGAAWHLELVHDDTISPSPTEEDLLVLYVDGPIDPVVIKRLLAAGGTRVTARNPYWEQWGVTVADPDGYRVVISQRGWENK